MKKLSDLLKGVAVLQRVGQADVSIDNVQFDSRKVSCNTLFVAQRGTVADGHQYIGVAIEKGAVVIVAQTLPQELKDGVVSTDEIGLKITKSNMILPCGVYGRWECNEENS